MIKEECESSLLGVWLRKKCIKSGQFSQMVGCSRPVIWKVKRGIAISPAHAKKIFDLTGGEIEPKTEKVGRPW
jgi:hypothetical protein